MQEQPQFVTDIFSKVKLRRNYQDIVRLVPSEDLGLLLNAYNRIPLDEGRAVKFAQAIVDAEAAFSANKVTHEAAQVQILRQFHDIYGLHPDKLKPEAGDSVASIIQRINAESVSADREAVQRFKIEADEAELKQLEKKHWHFSGNVIENFKDSTPFGRFGRVLGVTAGAILVGKACTYDRHTDQDGKTPHPFTKYLDMGAGLALAVLSLCILPNGKGPLSRMFELTKNLSGQTK